MVEKSSQGNFVPKSHHDILVEAIGRLEQCGRVRATGKGVELNNILELHHDTHPPPLPQRPQQN